MRAPNLLFPSGDPGLAPVRIAILGTLGVPARFGASETLADELSVRLSEAGFDVTVFCPATRGPRPTRHGAVHLEYAPRPGSGALAGVLYDALCLWRARRSYDVVYMLGYGSSPFCILPRLFGRRVWIHMAGAQWHGVEESSRARRWMRFAERIACRVASRLVFDSRAVADEVTDKNPTSARTSVIAQGIPRAVVAGRAESARDFLGRHGIEPGEYYLALYGRESIAHVHEMVEAHRRADCQRPLVLATTEVDAGEASGLPHSEAGHVCVIREAQDGADLSTLRKNCRAYVHGLAPGAGPAALLEAMACASVILSRDQRFQREVLGKGGRFYSDVEGLARLLAEVELADPALLRAEGARARERVLERYSWERMAEAYTELLGGVRERVAVGSGRRAS